MSSKRFFLIGWIVVLFILGGLAAWFTFGPSISSKAVAFKNYQKTLGLPGQEASDKLPVQVGISIEKISDFSIKNVAWNADFYVWFRWQPPADVQPSIPAIASRWYAARSPTGKN